MTKLRLLNDEEYARILANDLLERKNYSIKRIKQELCFHGISRDIIENTIDLLDNDPVPRIIILIKKKYINKINDEKGRKRTVDALLRLGYSYSDIKSALNSITDFEDEYYD